MPHREDLDAVFALIVEAALNNERCPMNYGFERSRGTIPQGAVDGLVKEGKIRVEVYAKNYRVIEIMWGRNAGKRTKPPDNKHWKPYKVLPKPQLASIKTAE